MKIVLHIVILNAIIIADGKKALLDPLNRAILGIAFSHLAFGGETSRKDIPEQEPFRRRVFRL